MNHFKQICGGIFILTVCKGINKIMMLALVCGLAAGATPGQSADQPQALPDKKAGKTDTAPVKYIVKDGAAQGKLYLPANFGKPVQLAAKELHEHLKKMTGAELETAWRQKGPNDSGFVFVVRPEIGRAHV